MKLQVSELPLGKPQQTRRKTPKIAPLIALTVLLTIPLYYPSFRDSSKKLTEESKAYESLQDSAEDTIQPTSHLEYLAPPVKEDINQPCSAEAERCESSEGGDDTVVQRHVSSPVGRRNVKGRRTKARRAKRDVVHRRDYVREENTIQKFATAAGHDDDRIETIRSKVADQDKCDLFTGEWVPNPEGPYYTNETCNAIQEHQNCLKFGRPDTGFLQWRWKPDDCDLPIFDPVQFLELVRGKSIAFVGDSVARNHMQSLVCLLSRTSTPVDLSHPLDQNKRYEFNEHDFNISMFWSPYLVHTDKTDPDDEKRPFNLHLDEVNLNWTTKIPFYDYVIISAGHWFFRPTYFYLNRQLVGCLYCPETEVSHLKASFSYRRAFRTALRAINEASDFVGVAFLRTFAPSHFEGGPWDKGGDCVRTAPFRRNETALEDYSLEMYLIQLEELRIAQKAGRRNGGAKFRLFDATKPMLLRPDGHPSKYGHLQGLKQSFANDCVHWCLPGPIDSWNDFLLQLLKIEV
ncbi:protein trichome birefringence-like 19 isoform X1 [Primulina eburnea]|uniref:protein trichome birefringence-like 19 isoform X1 n=1 Tax=Primulina eburnea TaxID=1245227 RepID=UPI003C6C6A14